MAGWGVCRGCRGRIWWGSSPYGTGKAFPFDDAEEEQSHFDTCEAQRWVTDLGGECQRVSTCRACGAAVWWQTTFRGRRRPMDISGDIALDDCHFETCVGYAPGFEPEPEPARQQRAADPSVAGAPYAVRLWLPDLGLSWPCTVGDVTSAFRRLALLHHPDMGGNAAEFIRIKLAYDRLRQLLGMEVTA